MKLQSGSRLKCMMWAAGNTGNDFGGGSITVLYNPLKQDQHDYISLTGVFDELKPPPHLSQTTLGTVNTGQRNSRKC